MSISKKGKQSKKNAEKSANISAEQSQINFLKLQLNAAITRITKLDTEISDYEIKLEILMATIKAFEERDNKAAYEQNFPNAGFPAPPKAPVQCPHTPPTPHCPIQQTCSHQTHCSARPSPFTCSPHNTQPCCPPPCTLQKPCDTRNLQNDSFAEVNAKLVSLCSDVATVKSSIFLLETSLKLQQSKAFTNVHITFPQNY